MLLTALSCCRPARVLPSLAWSVQGRLGCLIGVRGSVLSPGWATLSRPCCLVICEGQHVLSTRHAASA
jgi:hypothetical protein